MNKNIKDELYNVFDNMISSNYNDVAKKIKNNKGVILNMEKKRKSKFFVTGGFGLAFAVILDGALPRKTFSMGHSDDKRFYFECRKIK